MAMIECKECKTMISSKAQKCPNCGVKRQSKVALYGGGFLMILFFLYVVFGQGMSQSITASSIADDQIEKYNMAKSSGNLMDACGEAGLIAQMYLQAGDNVQYNQWTATSKTDCKRAMQ